MKIIIYFPFLKSSNPTVTKCKNGNLILSEIAESQAKLNSKIENRKTTVGGYKDEVDEEPTLRKIIFEDLLHLFIHGNHDSANH